METKRKLYQGQGKGRYYTNRLIMRKLASLVPVLPLHRIAPAILVPATMLCPTFRQGDDEAFRSKRDAMVTQQIEARGIDHPEVLRAMRTVPRHLFVSPQHRNEAYDDHPLPIGLGQTISQPYIVALMTQLADLDPDDVVLEVGTGSGYQAAVLSEIVEAVYTVELLAPLGEQARERLQELGYANVESRIGDGYHGWAEHAPFDAILVTAAAGHIPEPLVAQLKPGGLLIIPVGEPSRVQTLMRVEKAQDGTTTSRSLIPVRFVPLVGEH